MNSDPSVLFTVAEIAVAFAGFSAIVVLFRRSDSGRWRSADADRFNGMLLHAMAAALFALLPAMLDPFVAEPSRVLALASGILAVQVVAHIAVILTLTSTGRFSRLSLVPGAAVAVLLGMNALGVVFHGEFGVYLLGVLWHVFHAGMLFVWLIWISEADIEERSRD